MTVPNENDSGGTFETVSASAGTPQRPSPVEALAAVSEPSRSDLDARQAAFGERAEVDRLYPKALLRGCWL